MGRTPKSQPIKVQNLTKVPFSNKDLVWTNGVQHGGQNKMLIEIAYVPYVRVLKFLEGEQKDMGALMEWHIHKNLSSQMDVKHPIIKNHLKHTW
jgi:hypothetical protein